MSLETALETLHASDPEFGMLLEALYGDTNLQTVYDDLTGVEKFDRIAKGFHDDVLYRAARSTLPALGRGIKGWGKGVKQGATAKPKVSTTHGPMTGGDVTARANRVSRGQSVGAAVRNPIGVVRRHPVKAGVGLVGTGAVLEHRRANKPVKAPAYMQDPTAYSPPDPTDPSNPYVHKMDDRTKRATTAGLSAVGAGAGAYGLYLGGHELVHAGQKAGAKGVKNLTRAGWKGMARRHKVLLPLEAAGLAGEVSATHILHGDTKKPKLKPVVKNDPGFEATGVFSKFDEDKRLAFGWASIVKKDGLPVLDRQGDYITPEDLEEAAYKYVLASRVGGDMHRRVPDIASELGEDKAHHVADLVESFVLTPEKIAKMGLPSSTPIGWWVGFKVNDEDTWQEVKKGGRTGFSIHGKGRRRDLDYDKLMDAA